MTRLLVVSLLACLTACPPPIKGKVPKSSPPPVEDKSAPAGDDAAKQAVVPDREAQEPASDKVSPPDN